MFFATCSVSRGGEPIWRSKYSSTPDTSGEPLIRSACANARRRIAACRHCGAGCSHAPRPGWLPAVSTVTASLPFPDTATTRSNSTANSRFRQPTHVRTGPCGERCVREPVVGVSRWITAQSTHTATVIRTRSVPPVAARRAAAQNRVPISSNWPRSASQPVSAAFVSNELDRSGVSPAS